VANPSRGESASAHDINTFAHDLLLVGRPRHGINMYDRIGLVKRPCAMSAVPPARGASTSRCVARRPRRLRRVCALHRAVWCPLTPDFAPRYRCDQQTRPDEPAPDVFYLNRSGLNWRSDLLICEADKVAARRPSIEEATAGSAPAPLWAGIPRCRRHERPPPGLLGCARRRCGRSRTASGVGRVAGSFRRRATSAAPPTATTSPGCALAAIR
jgi:hypothetical protein